ncbi:MAG: MFS transporter [Deltaproteobacteria bacterium]|jgi:OFA family oxalate/formate antiporter-like MFS transporter|nr:MFS transporter [Deltaproteobacteria bacterium]
MSEVKKFRGNIVAGACFFIMFMHLGAIGSIGVFLSPIAEGNGWKVGDVAILITWATATAAIVGFVAAAPIIKALTPKWSLFVSTILCAGHYYWLSVGTHLIEYYLAAAIAGLVIALGTSAAVGNIIGQWFIAKRASMIGLVFGGAAFGTAVWQSVGGILIKTYGYRSTYAIMGTVLLIVALLANLLFITTPDKVGQKALGADQAADKAAAPGKPAQSAVVEGLTLKESLRTTSFYLLFIGVLLVAGAWTGCKSYLAPILRGEYGMDYNMSSQYTSIMNLVAAATVIIGGFIAQKLGNKVYLCFLVGLMSIGAIVILMNPGTISIAVLILALILLAWGNPSQSAMPPTVTTQAFGNKEYGKIMVYLLSAVYIGQAILPILVKIILARGYSLHDTFYFFLGAGLIGLVLMILGMQASPLRNVKTA